MPCEAVRKLASWCVPSRKVSSRSCGKESWILHALLISLCQFGVSDPVDSHLIKVPGLALETKLHSTVSNGIDLCNANIRGPSSASTSGFAPAWIALI